MRILITGGFGFQGKHLASRLLSLGHEVVLLVSPQVTDSMMAQSEFSDLAEIMRGDILDADLINLAIDGVDVVFHLAGKINPRESVVNPKMYLNINVDGSLVILEAVRRFSKRLFYVSSCAVYGDGSHLVDGASFSEESPLLPIDPYGASKVAADRLCYAYFKSYGLDVTVIRPFTTYGPGQSAGMYGGLIPTVANRALSGESLVVFGDGSAIRDFIYIDDLIDAYVLLLNTKGISGEAFNVASGHESKVFDVVQFMSSYCNVEIEYKPANPTEVKRYAANISKIKRLGFVPKIQLEDGIKSYIESLTSSILPKS